MQEPTLQQQIREYEANMPPEIMNLIKSFDWKRELRTIVNQNQIMVDVGADLEESTYLMILGIVNVEDVYDRMIEVHEYSEDKTKKILQEIEVRIFNPLSKQLQQLEDKDNKEEKKESIVSQAYSHSKKEDDSVDSRESILAEIEKEDPAPTSNPKPQFQSGSATSTSSQPQSPKPIELSSNGEIKKPQLSQSNLHDSGVRKPFSMKEQGNPQTEPVQASPSSIQKPSTGLQEDPMESGFKNPITMENKKDETTTQNPQSTAPRAIDPYREPIE